MDVHVIPKAAAKIGLRIPPGQDKDDAIQKLMDYLKTVAPWGVEVLPATGGANGQALLTAEHPGQSGAGEAAGEQAGAGGGCRRRGRLC